MMCSVAHADSKTDLSGGWKFRTALFKGGCVISGDITFTPAPAPLDYTCTFVSREDCTTLLFWKTFQEVRQSCTVTTEAGRIIVTSEVEEIVDAGPPSQRERMLNPYSYRADNFDVTAVREDELTGFFRSINEAPIRFWREVERIS